MYFAAAHRLRDYEGECENLHGHNWRVEICLRAQELDETGMLMDFKEVKRILKEALRELDHTCLNEVPPFDKINPTTELISRHVAEKVSASLPQGVHVGRVTCWESEKCGASYVPARREGAGRNAGEARAGGR